MRREKGGKMMGEMRTKQAIEEVATKLQRATDDGITAIYAAIEPGGTAAATAETLKLVYSAALLVLARVIATADDPNGWLLRNVPEILPQMVAERKNLPG